MLKTAIKAAKEAGEIAKADFGNVNTEFKGDVFEPSNIVTKTDVECEEVIVNILSKTFPSHNIFGEEKTDIKKNSPYTWYIDPIDGTSNFSRNIPLFGMSIGLTENDEPILGVLYFPMLDLLLYAEKGRGSFANNEKISVSKRPLNQSLYYAGSYYKKKLRLNRSVSDKVGILKMISCSSFALAQIAMGDAEIYLLTSIPHDVVAGVVIVEEAGGKVTDFEGNPWTIHSKNILVTNKNIHEEVVELIKKEKREAL